MTDLGNKIAETRLAILERILVELKSGKTNMPAEVRALAETYAWVSAPSSSHGTK